ncbi:STAS domain-containing protein [Corallibacter sp.]|uniref:STAS domain-containing protein n=1 Tax=Corallibacter sp. TaxID=2038084 RepID=UPI003AB5DFD0
MNLTITNNQDFFKVKGILNRHSVAFFQQELERAFEKQAKITINIEGIESIDRFGVMAFAKLHNNALQNNKSFSIIGLGCKDLYEHFKSVEAA